MPTAALSRLQTQLSPATLLWASLLLLATLINLGLARQQQQQQQQQFQAHYGQALADIAARQAVDATLNHDLLGLQALLADIASNPKIIGATIHDVEYRLLVQAGHLPNQIRGQSLRSYSAAITLHDSIAGHLTVTLDDQFVSPLPLYWQMGTSSVLLLLLGLMLSRQLESSAQRQTDEAETESQDSGDAPAASSAAPLPIFEPQQASFDTPSARVRLTLQCHNLDALHGQLNSSGFKQLLSDFENQLQGVLALYNGKQDGAMRDTCLQLVFSGHSACDCSFRAACSAQLLLQLCQQQPGANLQLSAAISPLKQNASLSEQFQHRAQQAHTSANHITIADELVAADLQERLAIDEAEPLAQVRQIKSPYVELLDKQLKQLGQL